uniref:BHLH domain-containing protein n=1 Tax=Steinernema glaseri TaxID=37863 RepID=A0A1I8ARL8_9BILA
MEFPAANVLLNDPFLSLDTDLDDLTEVIRNQPHGQAGHAAADVHMMMWEPTAAPQHAVPQAPQQLLVVNDYGQQQMVKSESPDAFYQKEIGSIVSQLRPPEEHAMFVEYPRNGAIVSYDYGAEHHASPRMAPPTLSMGQSAASSGYPSPPMDPQTSQYAPMQQHYAAVQNSYFNGVYETASSSHGAPLQQQQQQQQQPCAPPPAPSRVFEAPQPEQGDRAREALNTKEELLRMLLQMSPEQLERLKSNPSATASPPAEERQRRPSGPPKMATPAPLTESLRRKESRVSLATSGGFSDAGSSPLVSPSYDHATVPDWGVGDDSDIEMDTGSGGTRKGPKVERRTAHNLIEKKYRSSINDRIQVLKVMLAGDDAKLSKSVTLRKAIEAISSLRAQNSDLRREVEKLRGALKVAGIEPPPHEESEARALLRKAKSFASESPLSSPSNSPESSPTHVTNMKPTKTSKAQRGSDKSHVTLFTVMLMMVVFNPFAYLFATGTGTAAANTAAVIYPRRTLSEDAFDMGSDGEQSVIRPFFIWSVNLLVMVCVLTRLLVYGEPVTDSKSTSWTEFVELKRSASSSVLRGNYKEAQRQLQEALQILNRPMPCAGVDELISVTWHIIRHFLNSIWIGRWFSRRSRSSTLTVSVVCRSHAATALLYHQLHQLHMIGVDDESGSLAGLHLALCAVNLAEAAGIEPDGVTHGHRADIYVNMALRIRSCLPRYPGALLAAYFMKRAKRHAGLDPDDAAVRSMQWLFHPVAKSFLADTENVTALLNCSKHMNHFPFSTHYLSVKPIDRLTSAYKMHLLWSLAAELQSSTLGNLASFVEMSHLLLNISTHYASATRNTPKDASMMDWDSPITLQGDDLCSWWTHVVTCALYWKYADTQRAHKHYAVVRKCPAQLLKNNLALSVGHAFCSRKLFNEDREKKDFSKVVWIHIRSAAEQLQKISGAPGTQPSHAATHIEKLMLAASYEWVLVSLVELWQSELDDRLPYWEQSTPPALKALYRDLYRQYRAMAHANVVSKSKMAVFEVTSRMINSANPLTTWQTLLKMTRRRRRSSSSSASLSCASLGPHSDPEPSTVSLIHWDVLRKLHQDMNLLSSF